jgi:hypothetical protein
VYKERCFITIVVNKSLDEEEKPSSEGRKEGAGVQEVIYIETLCREMTPQ